MNKIILLAAVALLFTASAQKAPGDMMNMEGLAVDPAMGVVIQSEAQYIAHMIPHHQEAVESAARLSTTTQRPELKAFAQRIVKTQREEVSLMQGWLTSWYPNIRSDTAYKPMMRASSTLDSDTSDRMFLEDMIMHHQMAVATSKQLLNKNLAKHEEVAKLARVILEAQQSEIILMQNWLRDWYSAAPMMSN